MGKKIAVLGDTSDHGGELITTNTDGSVTVDGIPVCVEGCIHRCAIGGHGDTAVTAVTVKSRVNGLLVVTEFAQAGCGALIQPVGRGVEVE